MVQVGEKKQQPAPKRWDVAPRNVLVVCHGNLMRSPLASAVLVKELGQDRVRSRGVRAKNGSIAAKKVREFAAEHGYDLTQHYSQCLSDKDIEWANIVLYMDSKNHDWLTGHYGMDPADARLVALGSHINLEALHDPCYEPRGPKLTKLLTQVLEASKAAAEALR